MIALDTKVLVPIILVFAYLGFRRGASRELLSLVGILVASAVTESLRAFLTKWVNRLYRFGLFTVKGGLGAANPGEVMGQIDGLAVPISTPEHENLLVVISFLLIVAVMYFVGQDAIRQEGDLLGRFLGLFVGGLNGFLSGRFLFPRLFPDERTNVTILSRQISDYLGSENVLVWAAVVFCLIMIVYGVRSSSRPSR